MHAQLQGQEQFRQLQRREPCGGHTRPERGGTSCLQVPHPRWTVLLQEVAGLTCAAFCFHALLALSSTAPVSENLVADALAAAVNSGGVWLLSL